MNQSCWSFFGNVGMSIQKMINWLTSFLFSLFIEILRFLLIVGFLLYGGQRFLRVLLKNSKLFQTGKKALEDPEERVAENGEPKIDAPATGPGEESWWQRIKDWYGRNKRYLGYAMLALATAILLYHFLAEPPRERITIDANLLDDIQQKLYEKSDMGFSELQVQLRSRKLFFDKWVALEAINGADLFLKEGEFVKTMTQVFHFYEQNPEQAKAVEKPLQVLGNFLDRVLHVKEPADQIYFVDRGLMAGTIDRYDRALLD